jgi:tetratricopeptide (TPR) repeat protein
LAMCCVTLLACSAPTEKANSYYQKGMELLAQGNLLKAKVELQNALQIKPDLTAAWFALAQIAEQQGDWQQLLRLLSKVVDHDPRHLEAQVKLGRILLVTGRIDQARAASDAAFDIAPGNAEVLGLRAGLLYTLDDIPGALLQAQAALALNPSNIDGLVVLMTERLTVNAGPQALEYLDRALRASDKHLALRLINPQVVDALAQTDSGDAVLSRLIALYPDMRTLRPALAQFYLLHGRADAAEAEYRTIAAEHPSEVQLRLDLVRFVATSRGPKAALQLLRELIASDVANSELNFALVTMLQAQGDQQAAEALLRSIMGRSGSSPDGIKAKALLAGVLFSNGSKEAAQTLLREVLAGDKRNEEGLLLKARLAIDEHQIDQAIADIRSILHDSPNSPRALLLQARAYEVSGALALAQESYLRAYEAGRPAAQFAQAYAEFLLRRGQAARAESVANGILRLEPLHAPALRLLAQAQISQGDWVGAQKVAEQLSTLAGQQVLAEQVRGELFAARKEYAQSIAAFRRAYTAAPLEVQSMVALARAYVTAGKAPEAIAFLNSVIKNDPENISALLLLGELQVAKGDVAAAARSFQAVIELQPSRRKAISTWSA